MADLEAISAYRATLLRMHAGRVETGGDPESWNLLVNQMQELHLRLRETPEGRQAITNLIDDENETVRGWSATNALAWEPERAKRALEALAAETAGMTSFSAQVTLREFEKGRLKTDWVPKGP